ncbi:MAG: acyl-CoA dehydrogenase family protein [Paracoccaceae bacterium]|nr:acyl-CoA dehydrogenase family protein [Paracoccaceae bacterium]
MELSYTQDEIAFRDEVRAWLAKRLSKRLVNKVRKAQRLTKADYKEWHALLVERGWMAWHWPVEHGGTGWTPVQKHIFEEEMIAAGAPRIIPFGVNMLGPVLIEFGSQAQKDYYLPRILNDEDWWAQGYSEPGAGSDLASLKTSAVRDGGDYVVNGQKTWTTLAHFANRIFCLVRTGPDAPKPQQGISFLLMEMDTPGIEVRPIYTLEGEHEVNEVFFSDVRVPVENLVGEENQGWTIAKYLLNYERTGIAGVGFSKQSLGALRKIAQTEQKDGRPLADDPHFAARIARLEIDLLAMEIFNLRVVAAAGEGKLPGAESSLLKIKGTQVRQEATDLMRRAVGPYAAPDLPEAFDEGWNGQAPGPDYALPLARGYFNMRKTSIYGGSNEIQRNIVAKHLLGF